MQRTPQFLKTTAVSEPLLSDEDLQRLVAAFASSPAMRDLIEGCITRSLQSVQAAMEADPPRHPGPSPTQITKRQREALLVIQRYIDANGHSPTGREIAESLGVHELRSVYAMLEKLQRAGAIRREKGRQNAIELLVRVTEL